MSLTQFKADIDAVRASLSAGDYAGAQSNLSLAKASFALIPRTKSNDREIEMQSNALDSLEESIIRMQGAAGHEIQRIPEVRIRAT